MTDYNDKPLTLQVWVKSESMSLHFELFSVFLWFVSLNQLIPNNFSHFYEKNRNFLEFKIVKLDFNP